MPMTLRCAAVPGEADHHARMGRAGDRADDDIVEREAEVAVPAPAPPRRNRHSRGRRICAPRRRPEWRMGLPPCASTSSSACLPALADADIEALIDQADVRAHDAAEQDVADTVIDRILMRHPAFLHQAALHADLGGDRRDHAGVVRLHAADRDQRVGVGGDRVGDDVFELPELVAAEREAGVAVFALGVELDVAAEMRGQAR